MSTAGKGRLEKEHVTVNTGNVPESRLAVEMIPPSMRVRKSQLMEAGRSTLPGGRVITGLCILD